MTAYIVVQGTVTDPVGFAEYAREVSRLVDEMGGRYIVVGGDARVLEGEWQHGSLVVHEWPDRAAAQRFWDSPEYARIKKLREGRGRFVVVIADGVPEAGG